LIPARLTLKPVCVCVCVCVCVHNAYTHNHTHRSIRSKWCASTSRLCVKSVCARGRESARAVCIVHTRSRAHASRKRRAGPGITSIEVLLTHGHACACERVYACIYVPVASVVRVQVDTSSRSSSRIVPRERTDSRARASRPQTLRDEFESFHTVMHSSRACAHARVCRVFVCACVYRHCVTDIIPSIS